MAFEMDGRIVDGQGSAVALEGCRIEASFEQHVPVEDSAPATPPPASAGFVVVPQRVVAMTDAEGRFFAVFPDRAEIASETVEFIASSPAGRTIGSAVVPRSSLAADYSLVVQTDGAIGLDPESGAVPEPVSRRIHGRLIDLAGVAPVGGLNVVVYGAPRSDEGAGADRVLFATRTDGNGYFFAEWKPAKLAKAFALVSGYPSPLDVTLEEQEIPARVILVLESPIDGAANSAGNGEYGSVPRTPSQGDIANSPDAYSTDLGTGRCVQFNVPNRAIEEFDFYTVVRTTEPEIRGTTYNDVGSSQKIGGNRTYVDVLLGGRATRIRRGVPTGLTLRRIGPDGSTTGAAPAAATSSAFVEKLKSAGRDPVAVGEVLRGAVSGEFGDLTDTDLDQLERWTAVEEVDRVASGAARPPGRAELDAGNPVDWDSTPTFYEAATIAHGHILHFKQVWYADGYSLGDLLYSLPLAPGQKKLVSVVDWERREDTSRDEDTLASESLYASLSRNRDVKEVVSGTLSESVRGGSKAKTSGVAGGLGSAANGSYYGVNFGAVTGISGGYGGANSKAWQNASRDFSSKAMQQLRDRTLQSASAVRGIRSTVVHTTTQGEAVRATTEVVANHNHCHALTVQYFEVLRHFKVAQELADVQPCLFVPLPMSAFDRPKTLRWRQPLELYLQQQDLASAFDATQRVHTNWSEVDYPAETYADELVTSLRGELQLTLFTPLPPFEVPDDAKGNPAKTAEALAHAIRFLGGLLGAHGGGSHMGLGTSAMVSAAQSAAVMAMLIAKEETPAQKYARFQREVMPGVAAGFADKLELHARVGNTEVHLSKIDFTLVGEYRPGGPMLVSFRGRVTGAIKRSDISSLVIKAGIGLPDECRAVVNSVSIRYRTRFFEHELASEQRLNDDLDMPKIGVEFTPPSKVEITKLTAGLGATIDTPTDPWEQRNPRKEDQRLSNSLVQHLNTNLEYYHHAIWWSMDPNRRYMLLDGFVAPGSGARSVASVVENRLLGIAGNSLIMPVARGNHLDPRFKPEAEEGFVDLYGFYAPETPVAAARVSLPTRGVFAEAVMGACNACEKIDDSRYWRWEESPIDEPPPLDATAATTSRRTEPAAAAPSGFPSPIISIQNAPAAPDPSGVRVAADTVAKQAFGDFTGLAANQANAAAAYQQALSTALAFGKEASALAQQAAMLKAVDKSMDVIDKAEAGGKIDSDKAKDLRMSALSKMVGDAGGAGTGASDVRKRLDVVAEAARSGAITREDAQELSKGLLKQLTGDGESDGTGALSDLAKRLDPDGVQEMSWSPAGGGSAKVVLASSDLGSGKGKTAPAPKTGMSGLGDKNGDSPNSVVELLNGSKRLVEAFGKGLQEWKDSPDADLKQAIADALYEAAYEAAKDEIKKIPVGRAMVLVVEYSMAFAEGIERGLLTVNQRHKEKFQRAYNIDADNRGLTPDDVDALRYVTSYQAGAIQDLKEVLLAGVDSVVDKALKNFSKWVVDKISKKLKAVTDGLVGYLLEKSPAGPAIYAALEIGGAGISGKRKAAYKAALNATLTLYVRQLNDAAMRARLKSLPELFSGREPVEKEVFNAIAGCVITTGMQATVNKSLRQNLEKETRDWLYKVLKERVDVLRSRDVTVEPSEGTDVVVTDDAVSVPAALLVAIEQGQEAADDLQFRKWMKVSLAVDEMRNATAARLTLLARMRRPRLVHLWQQTRVNPPDDSEEPIVDPSEAYNEAYEAYAAEIKADCERVHEVYEKLSANGELSGESIEFMDFEFIELQDPEALYVFSYNVAENTFRTPEKVVPL